MDESDLMIDESDVVPNVQRTSCLTQSPGFTLRFEEAEDVTFTDRSLDVSDQLTAGLGAVAATLFSQELDLDLNDTTSGTSAAEHFGHASVLLLTSGFHLVPTFLLSL